MKKIIYLLIALGFLIKVNGQSAFSDSLKKHYLDIYHQSIAYYDAKSAINALHGYISLNNNNQAIIYKDTLAMLYFANQDFFPSLLLSQEVLKQDPNNVNALARTAECYQARGNVKEAIDAFEQVCKKVKNPYYNYQLGMSQYQLKRIAESENNLKIVLSDTSSNKIAVAFPFPNGSVQQIPVSAGALNLMGVIQMDAKNYDQAKKYFEEALKIFPDFVGAQQNINAIANIDKKNVPIKNNKGKN